MMIKITNRNILNLKNLRNFLSKNLLSLNIKNFGAKEKLVYSANKVSQDGKDNQTRVIDPLNDDEIRRQTEERVGFKKLTDFLLKREQYTWQDYLQQIIYTNQTDRSVWKRFRLKQDEEKQELNDTNKFVAALFPDEGTKEDFTIKEIKDLSKIAEVDEGFIMLMINNYRYHKGLHQFMREQDRKGLPLPLDQEQLFDLANSNDPPEFIMNFQKKMYEEIRMRLGFSEDYVGKMEQENIFKKAKKSKRTYHF